MQLSVSYQLRDQVLTKVFIRDSITTSKLTIVGLRPVSRFVVLTLF
jgi:hypothetical protein